MHEYLKVLREKAGHVPILVCGASVILVNGRGEILLHRRRDNGCWAFPGGAVDVFERVEDAARREILEETGLTVRAMRLFGVYSGGDMRHVYPNGDEILNVDILFLSDDFTGALLYQWRILFRPKRREIFSSCAELERDVAALR